MSRWNNRNNEPQQGINFATILNNKTSAIELLQVKGFVEQVKYKSSKFTQRIVEQKHRGLLYSFIDISLNPLAYMKHNNIVLDKTLTYGAIEVLSNLSEEFIQSIFDGSHNEQDEVVQTDLEYPILIYILKVLEEEEIEETSLAYLNKLITPFIYQRPEQMIKLMNSSSMELFYKHFWNKSISELFTKVLEAESQRDFFEDQKVKFIQKLCKCMKQQQKEPIFLKNIQSFYDMIQFIQEKHEDKYEKGKFSSLIRKVIENVNNFQFLIDKLQQYHTNKQIKINLLRCIEAYLQIHQIKMQSKQSEENQVRSEAFRLNENFSKGLMNYLEKHSVEQYCSDYRLEILYFYKILKTFLNIEPALVLNIINKRFIEDTLKVMEKELNNNILHNFQRQVIIKAILESSNVNLILSNELQFFRLLSANFSQRNSRSGVQSQLFLIGQALKAKENSQQNGIWNDLYKKIKQKRQFYSVQIGGNPKNQEDKWDNFESQMILPDQNAKQVEQVHTTQLKIEQKITMVQVSTGLDELGGTQVMSEQQQDQFNSNSKSQIKNNHFFDDLQLPLDSDKEEEEDKKIEEEKKAMDADFIIRVQSKEQRIVVNSQQMINFQEAITSKQQQNKHSFQQYGELSSSSSGFDYMSINKNISSLDQESSQKYAKIFAEQVESRSSETNIVHLQNFNIVDLKVQDSFQSFAKSNNQIEEFAVIDRTNSFVYDQNVERSIQMLRLSQKDSVQIDMMANQAKQIEKEQKIQQKDESKGQIQIKQDKQSDFSVPKQSQPAQINIPSPQKSQIPEIQSEKSPVQSIAHTPSPHKDEIHQILLSKYGIILTKKQEPT